MKKALFAAMLLCTLAVAPAVAQRNDDEDDKYLYPWPPACHFVVDRVVGPHHRVHYITRQVCDKR